MSAFEYAPQERLLRALAEQLKLPLVQIARQSELGPASQPVLSSIGYTADMAIRLIDSYLLSVQVQGQAVFDLEPVSVASMLQDVAHQLSPLAADYRLDLQLSLGGSYAPVMANRYSLESAYTMLGYAMIEAQASNERRQLVLLGAHRRAGGVVAGVFAEHEGLTADIFRRARALYGHARQPMTAAASSAGAGIFVADTLLHAMNAPLRVAHHHKMAGLAATLLPSQQLQII